MTYISQNIINCN